MDHVNWGKICLAILAAAVAGSMTDWLFFGVLFHEKYLVHPEVWKKREKGEAGQIMISSAVGLLATAAFILLSVGVYAESVHGVLKLAVAVWLIGSLPVVANEHIFMKLHPALFLSHSLGWLARFILAAIAYIYIGH